MWPQCTGTSPRWETIGVTILGARGHALIAPRGTALNSDGPLTTHVVVGSL